MKVTLFALNSSYIHTNLAVRCLSRVLRDAGHSVTIIERTLKDNREAILHDLYAENADLYGFSAYIWNVDELLRHAESLKLLRPHSVIAFGGPETSFETEAFFERHPYVDHILQGEGENAIVRLCSGVSCGKIIAGAPYAGFEQEEIPYDCVPAGTMVYYESSRGCPYQCAYCLSSVTEGVRAKTVEKTTADLLHFEQWRDSVKIVKFVDRTFNFDRNRAKQIWKALLDSRFSLRYHFEICADLLDEESFDILSQMPPGKIQLEIGVQSTHAATLRACGRQTDTEAVLANMQRLRRGGNIHIHADLIAGLPYEDYERFGQSFNDVYGSCDMLQLGFLKLLKGSRLRRESRRYGIKFTAAPPYTILCSDFISYEEMHRLHDVEAALERFGNSGRFRHTLKFVLQKQKASPPFRFYERFSGCNLTAASQNKACELLLDAISQNADDAEREILKSYVRFDYLLNETRRCPPFLAPKDGYAVDENLRRLFRNEINRGYEPHRFAFAPDSVYLIDRRNGRYDVRSFH